MAMQKRDLRSIQKIIVHCSDSDNPAHDKISVIRIWHRQRGFDDVGYHYFIRKNGEIEKGRPLYIVGAHCKNHNFDSIGICLSGKHEFTEAQFKSAQLLYYDLSEIITLRPGPEHQTIYPHNYFDKMKTCPNFKICEIQKYTNAQLIAHKSAKIKTT